MPSRANMMQWSVITLLGLAVLMVNSASMTVGRMTVTWHQLLAGRPTLYAVIAIVVMMGVGRIDLRKVYAARGFTNPIPWLLLIAIGLCVVALIPKFSAEINGSRRWLFLGPRKLGLTFQPSELAKWTMVLAVSWWCARRAGVMQRFWAGFFPIVVLIAVVCGLIVTQDLGTTALIGAVAMGLLVAGGARGWHLSMLLVTGTGGLLMMLVSSAYRMRRISSFMDPFADPLKTGYQLIQMLAAIAEGNRGLGNGIAKMGYVPAATTDAIFAIVVEELGVGGAALVMVLFLILLWTAFGVVRDCKWVFGKMVGLGVILTLGLQAVMNIAVVTGVVPTKGIALPFLSSGGTGWVMCAAAMGLLIALDRINQEETEAEKIGNVERPRMESKLSVNAA
ncbi:MAG: peptidoglycan glycosyltransferase FtsW [Phycisphaerales bacterium]